MQRRQERQTNTSTTTSNKQQETQHEHSITLSRTNGGAALRHWVWLLNVYQALK